MLRLSPGIVAATLATLLLGFVAGCLWAVDWQPLYGQSPADSLAVADAGSELFDKVRRERSLSIGVNTSATPFAMRTRDGGWIGIDVEIARLLGKELGVEIELVDVPTAERFEALKSGRVDLVIAAATRTPRRALEVNFSRPYLTFSQAALVRKDRIPATRTQEERGSGPSFDRWSDLGKLSGIELGVKADTTPEELARRHFPLARVRPYPTLEEAIEAMLRGDVGAVAHDGPFIEAWLLANSNLRFKVEPLLGASTTEHLGIAMRKGDLEFLTWLNLFVEEADASGELTKIRNHYLGDDGWVEQVER